MSGAVKEGHCLCGAIQYEADYPFDGKIAHCHCTQCRRQAGSVALTWFTVKKPAFRILKGTPKQFRSSEIGVRGFCGDCGTPITFESARHPEEIDVTLCSLKEDQILPADLNIHVESRLDWLQLDSHLPDRRSDAD